MKAIINIAMDNAAFGEGGEDWWHELGRILSELSDKVREGRVTESIRDINGNKVGTLLIK